MNSMGKLSPEVVTDITDKLRKKISSKNNPNVKELTELNNKLSDSYSVSLKIIVDVSKLLNQYMVFFNEIDKILQDSDIESGDTQTLNSDYLRYINKLTSDNINKMTTDFETQLETIIPIYQKNNIPTKDFEEYNTLLKNIKKDSNLILKSGGKLNRNNIKFKI
jgi:hypothetical protein